jgi:hypothetical protein
MNITLITGDHPRHKYLVNKLMSLKVNSVWIVEMRENLIPKPDKRLKPNLKRLFKLHFNKREKVEKKFFPNFFKNISLNKKTQAIICA